MRRRVRSDVWDPAAAIRRALAIGLARLGGAALVGAAQPREALHLGAAIQAGVAGVPAGNSPDAPGAGPSERRPGILHAGRARTREQQSLADANPPSRLPSARRRAT